jgi:serine/threonine protein kinase
MPSSADVPGSGADFLTGAPFAGYVIEGIAGRGGMGVVYRARQVRPSRIVALKVISPALAGDSGFRERFAHESEIAASIEHSNVIPVYEVGEDSGRLFIAMRYVDGTDLGRVIAAEGRVEPRPAVQILAQLTSALDAAHARGLVHRDVKPANVLIARESDLDHVYLTDFGLAKLALSGGQTRTGMFVGTIHYAAPEQFEGGRVDARTDVYAAGCVLYNMLTGSAPFPRDSEAAVMWAHLSAGPPSVREAVPDLPVEFDAVIARAMAKDPDDRYPSAGDLGRDAMAAVDRQRATVLERSVATGRAAPTAGSPGPPARTEITPSPAEHRGAGDATERTPARPGSRDDGPPTGAPARARPRAWLAAAGAGAVVAIAVIAVAASGAFTTSSTTTSITTTSSPTTPTSTTSSTTATTTSPPAPTTKTFTNAKASLSFAYPASWGPLTLSGTLADFGVESRTSETRCAVVIQRGAGPASRSQEAQIAFVRSRSAFAASQAKHYKVLAIQAEQGVNIAGVGLLRTDDAQGGHIGFFFRGRDVYIFDCITPASQLNTVDQQAFRPLLASVKIG